MACVHRNAHIVVPPKAIPAVPNAFSIRVAIVEDDLAQAEEFRQWLKLAGHRCHHFPDGAALIRAFDQVGFDALLLDWSLPSTLDLLRRIRGSDRASLPVLLVSGRSREDDVVNALRQGADDYLVKPVRRLELLARLEAIARRGRHRVEISAAIEAGTLRVDCATRRVWRNGLPVETTAKDFELSVLFLRNIGRLLSRGYLLDTVWGPNAHGLSRTLDTHISRLRKKLGLTPEYGWRLMPVYTRGYRLDQLPGTRLAYQPDRTHQRQLPLPASRSSSGGDEIAVEERFAGVVPDQVEHAIREEEHANRAGACPMERTI
jgi:DNA-binding response OmpR family regulator